MITKDHKHKHRVLFDRHYLNKSLHICLPKDGIVKGTNELSESERKRLIKKWVQKTKHDFIKPYALTHR